MKLKVLIQLVLLHFTIKAFAQEPKLMLPVGHTAEVYSAAFSPDGKKVVTASNDRTAKIWDAANGKLIADLKGHTTGVYSVVFSPDGKKVLTVSWDYSPKIWDAATGKLIADLKGHTDYVESAEFSPDGKKVITASDDRTAKIWDAATGKLIADLKGHTSSVASAEFSPDGKKILTLLMESAIKIWDAATGKLLHNVKGGSDTSDIHSAKFSPDGKKIVTASSDKTAKIWDVGSGKLIADLKGHISSVESAKFSPDGKKVLTISWDYFSKIWDAATGKLITEFKGHTNTVKSAEFSPDGKRIVTASIDKTAKIWDAATGKLITEFNGGTDYFNSAEISPDGRKVLTACSGKTAKIWDAETGKLLVDLKGHTSVIISSILSPDGKNVLTISMGSSPKIRDIVTGNIITEFKVYSYNFISAKFSPDGKRIVTADSWNNHVRVWDVATGKQITEFKGHTSSVQSAEFSPDGKRIVTASYDSTAKVWVAGTGKLIADLKGHYGRTNYAIFSPDGKKVVTASDDGTAKIWDAASGKLIVDLKGHTWVIFSAVFSPDETKIVTASDDETAKIWDAETGKLLFDLKGHKKSVNYAVFSPDGTKVVTASDDGTAKIWDATRGKQLASINLGANSSLSGINWNNQTALVINNTFTSLIDINSGKTLSSFLAVDSTDYLVVDSKNRYDGTPDARKLLYFTCDDEVIELDQVKDQLWVPNLAERLMKGETINAKTLNELNICGLVPLVEEQTITNNNYQFKITPRKGGLGESVLYVNGIEAKRYQSKELQQAGSSYTLSVSNAELQNYFVTGQENKITVKAYTKDNGISSRGGTLLASANTNAPTAIPNLYAVMVGVNDYKGTELDLKYAAKDATDLGEALGQSARKLLNTDDKEHVFLYNLTTADKRYQLPEKNSIKKVLEEIGKKATSNDILLIFFAGHGVTGNNTNNDKQFYFLTADASKSSANDAIADVGISTTELSDWIKPQNIKAQKRILIFDACNSGQAIKDFVAIGQSGQNYLAARDDEKAKQIKAIDKLNEKSGLFILAASASNQVAYEMGRYSQGMLTYALLSAIKQQPDILQEGKYLDVSRWFGAAEKMVTDLVKENGARQQPQVISTTNFNIGIVDDEVRAKIILPQEKPLFTSCNFQNADEAIDYDDKNLSKLVDKQLNDISTRSSDKSNIVYTPSIQIEEAWKISGRYEINGNSIKVRVNIRQGKAAPKYRIEVSGTTDKLDELANEIVNQVLKLPEFKK